jgi:flap endonuclease-1
MGIKGLANLIGDHAPAAIKETEKKNLFGRKIAIDASMCIYQFLIAVRQEDGNSLTNENGEVTSHLMGTFYRTISMMEAGIKPVWVFDGKPPELKGHELVKRQERRAEAQANLDKATDEGDTETMKKLTGRLVKVNKEHSLECQKLLELMGVPCVVAPCEAEAQCAALCKADKVYAVGTEDMDALTFGTTVLLRNLTVSEARKMPIKEFHVNKILDDMGLILEEFIDLCILLGCDYCETIRGIGPKKAVDLIKEHKSIEKIIEKIESSEKDSKKYTIPENWLYKQARELFISPEVTDPSEIDLQWKDPDVEGIIQYMCNEKGFAEDRMRNGITKIKNSRKKGTQVRLDSFFKVTSTTPKRKAEEVKGAATKKGKKEIKKEVKVKKELKLEKN